MSIWQTFQHLSFVNVLSIISMSKLFGTKSFFSFFSCLTNQDRKK